MSIPADAWLQGKAPRSASAVHALFDATCRCHAAAPDSAPQHGAPNVHALDPQLSMRTFRPLVQHVRSRMRGAKDRFAQWDQLHDDDRVSARTADAWLLEASHWLRDPVLGLNALVGLKRGIGDVVELAAESAPDLGTALTNVARFAQLIYEGADFHLHTTDQLACLQLRYTLPISHVSSDYVAALLLHGVRRWLGLPSGVQLWFKDEDGRNPAAYAAAFAPVSVQFGTRADAIVLPRAVLDLPIAGADPVLHGILVRFAEHQISARGEEAALSEQVRHQLTAVLSSEGNGHVGNVAKKLG
ncbi:MAG TPA: AraC family transcriptional regulator ligand-binding domain-containing protein, partial [Polyangiales bacterium]